MPRVVCLLTLIAALGVPIWSRGTRYVEILSPLCLPFTDEAVETWIYIHLLPLLFLGLACVLPLSRIRSGLQIAGSLLLLGLLGWFIKKHSGWHHTANWIPACGWALIGILESGLIPHRWSPDDPWRRPTASLWLVLAALNLYIASHLMDPFIGMDRLLFVARNAGLGLTCLVLAWGRWKSATWSSWVGALLASALAASTIWTWRRHISPAFWGEPDHLLSFLHRELSPLLILASLAFLSAREAWRSARMARRNHEATEKG